MSRAPQVTPEITALIERLHRACLTESCMPSDGPKGHARTWSAGKSWAATRSEWWDDGNESSKLSDGDIVRRFIAPPQFSPTPQEVDDWLPALALLDGPELRASRPVIRLRAFQEWYGQHAAADERYAHWRGGWRMIGDHIGRSYEWARQKHWEGVQAAWRKLHQAHRV